MKLHEIVLEASDPITPEIRYRESGDKSWTVRIDYGHGKVFVHTNKKRSELEKIVKARYGTKVFHDL